MGSCTLLTDSLSPHSRTNMAMSLIILSISFTSLVQAEAQPGYGHATSYIYRGVEGVHGHHGHHGHYGYGKRSAMPGYGGYYGQAHVYEDRIHGLNGHYGGYGYGKRSAAAADGEEYDRYYDGGHYTGHYHVIGAHVHHGHSE